MKPILTRAVRRVRPQDKAPVPYTPRAEQVALPSLTRNDATQQLAVYSADSIVFPIVNQLANATASVQWRLYRKARSGNPDDRTEYQGHAAADLWRKPNPWMPCQELVETLQQHIDLTGEGWMVIGRDPRMPTPLELWPMRPDRVQVIPSHDEFIKGYIYHGPDGELVPLEPKDVIQIRMPNPMDPYRGLGPIQAAMTDLDAARYAAMWNRNFFLNSAEPGGIIEVDRHLSDDEFDEMAARWNEQHKGVANAHRVAILEKAQWKDRKITQRDMQFADLRQLSDEKIRQAFAFPKPMLGTVDDVNLANARAAETVFSRWRLVPRLERWKSALNNDLLPLFGQRRDDLEFDYDNPTPSDPEQEIAERDSKIAGAVQLISSGVAPASAFEAVGLPEMELTAIAGGDGDVALSPREQAEMVQKIYLGVGTVVTWEEARQVLVSAGLPLDLSVPAPSTAGLPRGQVRAALPAGLIHNGRPVPVRPRNADDPPDMDPADLPDISRLQDKFDEVLDRLLIDWADLEDEQKASLVAQVLAIAEDGSIADLEGLEVDTETTAELLAAAMIEVAEDAADAAAEEISRQGGKVSPAEPDENTIKDVAIVVAAMVAGRLIGGAAGAAMRANGRRVDADDVAAAVDEHLAGLSKDGPRPQLSGALTGSQNEARSATLRKMPAVAIYASEVNDSNTCSNCRAVDGKWLGNYPEDADEIEKLYPGGAFGGYVDCLGRERCRGTITGVLRRGSGSG